MTDRELMQQALEALEEINKLSIGENAICLPAEIDEAMDALRERLAQPEQEPVATVRCINGITIGYLEVMQPVGTKLYTTPPQRKPLTDEELYKVFPAIATYTKANKTLYRSIARAVEAAHNIKGEA
mgnify:CR=1 FL=1